MTDKVKIKRPIRVGDLIVVYYSDGVDTGVAIESCDQHKANRKERSIRYLSTNSETISDTNGAVFEKFFPSFNALEDANAFLSAEKREELTSING